VPVVGLYGPKDPAVYGPWNGRTGEPAATVWKQVHCSPCRLRRCSNVICMPAIGVGDVAAAVERTLSDDAGSEERQAV
jgi:ADP-heptose:LPS heptosyltransferase